MHFLDGRCFLDYVFVAEDPRGPALTSCCWCVLVVASGPVARGSEFSGLKGMFVVDIAFATTLIRVAVCSFIVSLDRVLLPVAAVDSSFIHGFLSSAVEDCSFWALPLVLHRETVLGFRAGCLLVSPWLLLTVSLEQLLQTVCCLAKDVRCNSARFLLHGAHGPL